MSVNRIIAMKHMQPLFKITMFIPFWYYLHKSLVVMDLQMIQGDQIVPHYTAPEMTRGQKTHILVPEKKNNNMRTKAEKSVYTKICKSYTLQRCQMRHLVKCINNSEHRLYLTNC